MKLRQSLLRLFDRCPHSAHLYVKHGGGTPSHVLYRGTVMHAVLERATRLMVQRGEATIPAEVVKDLLVATMDEHPEWHVPASEMDVLRVMCQHFGDHFTVDPAQIIGIEQRLHLPVGDDVVTGTVDLAWVDGDTLHVRDYKSSPHVPKQDDLGSADRTVRKGAKSFQLIVYALLMVYGRPPGAPFPLASRCQWVDARFVYPMYAGGDEGLTTRGVTIGAVELADHHQWLKGLVARYNELTRRGALEAIPGSWCQECPAPADCPLPVGVRPPAIGTELDAQEAAEHWFLTERSNSRLKAAIKAYASSNEVRAIPLGGDLELGFDQAGQRFDKRKAITNQEGAA